MKAAINQATLMKAPMEEFLHTISEAGFIGVELRRDETFAYLETHSVSDLKELLTRYNLKVISWNAIELFSLCDEKEFQGMVEYSERLMKIGQEIGCDMIIAVPSFTDKAEVPPEQYFSRTVERFQALRSLAANYNFRMGFEPLGFPNCSVRKINLALKILIEAEKDGLPPSGLIIDTFHFFLGEHKCEDLGKIPLDRLWLIHFNDCVERALDTLQDHDRVWIGDGFFDLLGFYNQLQKIGYDDFLSLELFNEEYWTWDTYKAAKHAYGSLHPYL